MSRRNISSARGMVALVYATLFVISLSNNLIGTIMPDVINSFHLSLTTAGLLPFALFLAYGISSIPAGAMSAHYGEKRVMLCAVCLAACVYALFALYPGYLQALLAFFAVGICVAVLEVTIFPILRVAGGEAEFAFNSVVAQLVFGAASFISPWIFKWLVVLPVASEPTALGIVRSAFVNFVPANMPWLALYLMLALAFVALCAFMLSLKFPAIEKSELNRRELLLVYRELLSNKHVWLFFFGSFFYVGFEQGTATWMSRYLQLYHGLDPRTAGVQAVSLFWGMMSVGSLLGLALLKLMDSRKVLLVFSLMALLALSGGLFGNAQLAEIAFPLVGFCAAVMWSINFSLALNSVLNHQGIVSGIICTGVVGGAVMPALIGTLGDRFGLNAGMLLLYVSLLYLVFITLAARPLIKNVTIFDKKRN